MLEISRPHLALVGLMGAGKTIVGSAFAKRIHWRHLDLDATIENSVGRSVGVIFAESGEEKFRDLEEESLSLVLSKKKSLVLSTGGGVVKRSKNRDALSERAVVIWLRAKPETLVKRISHLSDRPLLSHGKPLEILTELARDRDSFYREVADEIIDTDNLDIESVVEALEQLVGQKAG